LKKKKKTCLVKKLEALLKVKRYKNEAFVKKLFFDLKTLFLIQTLNSIFSTQDLTFLYLHVYTQPKVLCIGRLTTPLFLSKKKKKRKKEKKGEAKTSNRAND
jgi:hypothetical protein